MDDATKKKKCPCEGGTLTRFIQPVVLSILSKETMNGYQMIQRMQDYAPFTDGGPDQAGVYRYIRLMIQRGYLRRVTADDNDALELLSITSGGQHCLEQWRITLRDYHKEIEELVKQI